MPSRGYRKGLNDRKVPVPCSIRTHITQSEFDAMNAAADARSVTLSKILRSLVTAFVTGRSTNLPHPRQISNDLIRELCREGNNLNQLVHHANLSRLPVLEAEARALIARINTLVARIG